MSSDGEGGVSDLSGAAHTIMSAWMVNEKVGRSITEIRKERASNAERAGSQSRCHK